jgi:hypothetical protein
MAVELRGRNPFPVARLRSLAEVATAGFRAGQVWLVCRRKIPITGDLRSMFRYAVYPGESRHGPTSESAQLLPPEVRIAPLCASLASLSLPAGFGSL